MWGFVLPLLLASYFTTPPIFSQIYVRTKSNPLRDRCLFAVERPLVWLAGHSKLVSQTYEWESELIDQILGPASVTIHWEHGNTILKPRNP